jgi:cytoskeletal protein CcmA (bactofilin family)/cytochrome c-type biogenesis protein CcmH/NrfG
MTIPARLKREFSLMLPDNARSAIRSPESTLAALAHEAPATVDERTQRVTVASGLTLRGEFVGCDHLAIAGRLESDVRLRALDILEAGSFKGSATVEEARIAGRYEGILAVAGTLVVGAAAYVSGSVQCDKLQLQEGGKIEGDLRILSEETAKAATAQDGAELQALRHRASSGPLPDADAGSLESGQASSPAGPTDAMFVAAAAAQDDALLAKAEECFRAALKANIFDVAALSGLGHLARQRGDLAGALNYFGRIMEVDTNNVTVRCVAIDILNVLSRHDEAAALAKEVLALQSQTAPLNDDEDEAATLPAFDEAEAMFKSVLDRHPKNLGALAGLGRVARRRGDRLAMLKYYTAALAIEPTNITLRLEVARALKEQGEVALAQQILEIVLAEQRATQAAG